MLNSLNISSTHCSFFPTQIHCGSFQCHSPSPPSPSCSVKLLQFRTSHRFNLRYLKTLGIINPHHKTPIPPETLHHILATVDSLKSKGFSDLDFSRLIFFCPKLFSSHFNPADIEPVFDFLAHDLAASKEESCGLIYRCPNILESNVGFCLRPTLAYLRNLGLQKLNAPTTLNARLLNTRVQKLEEKVRFLQSIGLSQEESAKVCARFPAIFGYSTHHNLRPKFEYFYGEMKRSLEELKEFPQYFAFSLRKRIAPRHIHLKQRNARSPLKPMLLWCDQKFYAKWK